jgi:hypothetical protein
MRVRGQIQPRFEHLSGYIEFWLRFIWARLIRDKASHPANIG